MNTDEATICRLCLEEGLKKTMVPLLNESSIITSTGKALSNFLDMKIKNDDNLPSKICKKCLVLLNQSIQFKQRCQTNYETLKIWSKNLLKEGANDRYLGNTLIQLALNNKNNKNLTKEDYTAVIMKESSVSEIGNPETKPLINSSFKSEDKKRIPKISIEPLKILNQSKDKDKIEPAKVKMKEKSRRQLFICEQCGKIFKEKTRLDYHLVGVHKDYTKCRVYSCELCNYKTALKLDLIVHNRTHTGERPFVCEECGEAFFRKGVLQSHKLKHQEKTLACEHCDSKFHIKEQLKRHINSVHIRQYSYPCYMCEKTYRDIGNTKKHLLKKHGVPRKSQAKVKKVLIAFADDKTGS